MRKECDTYETMEYIHSTVRSVSTSVQMVNKQEIPIATIQSDRQTLCSPTEIENKRCENNLL